MEDQEERAANAYVVVFKSGAIFGPTKVDASPMVRIDTIFADFLDGTLDPHEYKDYTIELGSSGKAGRLVCDLEKVAMMGSFPLDVIKIPTFFHELTFHSGAQLRIVASGQYPPHEWVRVLKGNSTQKYFKTDFGGMGGANITVLASELESYIGFKGK